MDNSRPAQQDCQRAEIISVAAQIGIQMDIQILTCRAYPKNQEEKFAD